MIGRVIGLAAARMSKKRWDPSEEPGILKILQNHANIFSFSTYPWTLWIIGTITLLMGLTIAYAILFILKKHE